MVVLHDLITELEKTPVSVGTLKDTVPDYVHVYSYKELEGKSRNDLFRKAKAIIVLIPKKGEKMGHFVALIPWKTHIEYFSSLGNSFEKELSMLGQTNHIQRVVGKHYIYNRTALQSGKYNIRTCAYFVLARVKLHKMKLRQFVQIFQSTLQLSNPDEIVSLLTLFSFI